MPHIQLPKKLVKEPNIGFKNCPHPYPRFDRLLREESFSVFTRVIPRNTTQTESVEELNYDGDNQKVIRFKDSLDRFHYVMLNGESGESIKRGEGHEQPGARSSN